MRTIKQLANEIRELWPTLDVRVERGFCNTDRKIGRLRSPGKGRWASRLIVRDPDHHEYPRAASILLDHNNAETYRTTADVSEWISRRKSASR